MNAYAYFTAETPSLDEAAQHLINASALLTRAHDSGHEKIVAAAQRVYDGKRDQFRDLLEARTGMDAGRIEKALSL